MKLYGYYHNSKSVSIKDLSLFRTLFCLFSVRDDFLRKQPGKCPAKQDDQVRRNKLIMFDKRQYFIIIII